MTCVLLNHYFARTKQKCGREQKVMEINFLPLREKKKNLYIYMYATIREWNKGQTTYLTQGNVYFLSLFGKNDVCALCPTTFTTWSEMSKFLFDRLLFAALFLGRWPNLRIMQNSYLHRRKFWVSLWRISLVQRHGYHRLILRRLMCLLYVTRRTGIITNVHHILGDFNMDGFYDGLVVLNITAPGWVSIKLRYNVWKIEVHRNTHFFENYCYTSISWAVNFYYH